MLILTFDDYDRMLHASRISLVGVGLKRFACGLKVKRP